MIFFLRERVPTPTAPTSPTATAANIARRGGQKLGSVLRPVGRPVPGYKGRPKLRQRGNAEKPGMMV